MNKQISEYLEKYPSEIIYIYNCLRELIFDSVPTPPNELLWAKIPSYYIGDAFVRLIPFKDHVNVEAKAISEHKEELSDYKITPKGMLQIYLKQTIPADTLKKIFTKTLIQSAK